jgi:hypothetical protein
MPGCRPGVISSVQPAGIESDLPPGAVSMVFAELKTSGVNPDPIRAVFSWKVEGKRESHQIENHPADVAPHARQWVVEAYALFKDFGLPLLLGLLAYLFQHALQDRSRTQAAHNVILPTATANAIKFLLPVASGVRNLRRLLDDAEASSALGAADLLHYRATLQESFFYFIFVLKRMRDLVTVGGGFFLKSLEVEGLVAECWRIFNRRVIDYFGYLDLSHTQDLMEGHETISQFFDQLETQDPSLASAQSAARRIAGVFPKWGKGGGSNPDVRLLVLVAEILQIEGNRLYLGWYEEVESPDFATLERWSATLRELPSGAADNLIPKLDRYVNTLSPRVRLRFFCPNFPTPENKTWWQL